MLYEILDETLTKLEEYEKTDQTKIKYKQVSFNSLKIHIRLFKDYYTEPTTSQLMDLNQ